MAAYRYGQSRASLRPVVPHNVEDAAKVGEDPSATNAPVRCVLCGECYDKSGAEVISRYDDCSVFRSPCCDQVVSDGPLIVGHPTVIDLRVGSTTTVAEPPLRPDGPRQARRATRRRR